MNFLSVLQGFWDGFWKGFQSLPRSVQVFVYLFFLAIIGFIAFEMVPRINPDKEFRDHFDETAKTLRATASPAYVASVIDALMNYAESDKQKCSVGGLYLDVAQELAHPLMPQSLKMFLTDGERRKVPCVAALAETAGHLVSHVSSQTPPPPQAGTTTASQRSVFRAATSQKITAASQVLQAVTNVGSEGWVYLGNKSLNSDSLTHPTINQTSIPSSGDSIATTVALNIRATVDPRRAMGQVLRVIPTGSTLRLTGPVVGVDHVVNGTKVGYYIWAPITITKRAPVSNTVAINNRAQIATGAPSTAFMLINPHRGPTTTGYIIEGEILRVFTVRGQRTTSVYVRNIGTKPVVFTMALSCPASIVCPSVQREIKPVLRMDDASNDYVYTVETLAPFTFDWDATLAPRQS